MRTGSTSVAAAIVLVLCSYRPGEGREAPATSPAAGWLERAQESIAAREYHASRNDRGLQAPNRRQGFRTYFEPEGVRVVDRTARDGPRLVDFRLHGFGREDALEAVGAGELHAAGARVEIRRPELVEWYVNRPDGLEQGFDVPRSPPGEGRLLLQLELEAASAERFGDGLRLTTGSGRRLDYGKLAAWDGDGTALEASLRLARADHIEIAVDDSGARYPITVDPLLTESNDTLLLGDQTSFGVNVASAGDVNGDGFADVLVASPSYDSGEVGEGAVFLFLGAPGGVPGGGPATADAMFESNQAGARLGLVSSAGDVNGDGFSDVIVGAALYDDPDDGEGAAFVFHGSALGMTDGNPSTAATVLQGDQPGANFGAVSSAGDVNGDGYGDVIVGALFYDAGEADEGAAFIFHGGPSGIANGSPATAATQIESDAMNGRIASGVAPAGDVNGDGYADVLILAPFLSGNGVMLFHGGAAGIPDGDPASADTRLVSGPGVLGLLGIDARSAGDVDGDGYSDVIIGAGDSNTPSFIEGGAYVFHGGPAGIPDGDTTTAQTVLAGEVDGTGFGRSVSGAGDVNGDGYADVIVGTPSISVTQAAYVFLGSASGIPAGGPSTAFASLDPGNGGALPGRSVASAGDVDGDGYADVIVGFPFWIDGAAGVGAALIYHGGATGIEDGDLTTANTEVQSDQMSGGLGVSVASAGDVNDDGYADVIVGASIFDAGDLDEGAAFVFHGGPGGIPSGSPVVADARLEGDQPGALFGVSVDSAGDVNGDGHADVIVGSVLYDAPDVDEGAAFVFLGGPAGIADGDPSTAHASIESDLPGALLGGSVASAGDVNGDGYGDVIVGARAYANGQSDEGVSLVFHGGASGVPDGDPGTADAFIEGDQMSGLLGVSVASAGDVNGDGYGDVVVGASGQGPIGAEGGAALVFHGGASGITGTSPANADANIESDQALADLGFSVASAGDVDADGFSDLIVGSLNYPYGGGEFGAAFFFRGGPSGILGTGPASADAELRGSAGQASFMGASVATAGDVDGDGHADVIVGAPFHNLGGQERDGIALLYLGDATGLPSGDIAVADARLDGDDDQAWMGLSVASAGDVNGDGFADVIVGAPQYTNGETEEGGAFVFHGSSEGAGGRPVLARQGQAGGGATIQPWAGAIGDAFDVSLRATHPDGRGRVKLEVEWCPAGVPFDDPACDGQTSPNWTDVTATSAGVTLTETIAGLTVDELYRWRARILHAPFRVTEPGISPAPNPSHGPWRRPTAQSADADVRVLPEPGGAALAAGLALLAALKRRR